MQEVDQGSERATVEIKLALVDACLTEESSKLQEMYRLRLQFAKARTPELSMLEYWLLIALDREDDAKALFRSTKGAGTSPLHRAFGECLPSTTAKTVAQPPDGGRGDNVEIFDRSPLART